MEVGQTGHAKYVEGVCDSINIYASAREFLDQYSREPQPSAMLWAAHMTMAEVCNGGFEQLFSNSTGVLAPEAVQGFQALKMPTIAHLVTSAINAFGESYPREREERQRRLQDISSELLDEIDQFFFQLIGAENGGFNQSLDDLAFSAEVQTNQSPSKA